MSFSGVTKLQLCCPPSDQQPNPVNNLIIFDLMSSFLYQYTPVWEDENGRKLTALEYNKSLSKLSYTWKFYKNVQDSLCDLTWFLHTSDNVVPVIVERISGTKMNVQRIHKKWGYIVWKVTC